MIRPAALKPGARVALVAPAGPLVDGAVERAEKRVREWGWEPRPGEHVGGRMGFLSAPDEARVTDLNTALRDTRVDAVWCLRGGYGTMRILERIDWSALTRSPKALIGFSDNTALHLAAQRIGMVSYHGPHPATKEFTAFSREVLERVLCRAEPAGALPFPGGGPDRAVTVTPGVAEGPLVGGNLSLVAATLGTPFAVQPRQAIVFLEEVGESAYRVDRLLTQLLLAGVFREAVGVAIGAFTETAEQDNAGQPAVEEVVRERLGGLGIPVAMGFPFGHVDDNWTLPMGIRARLEAGAGRLELLEPAVS